MFSQTSTDVPYYDDMIRNLEYYRRAKNATFTILSLSPQEYLELSADMQNTNLQQQERAIHQPSLAWFKRQVDAGKKLPLLYLNYISDSQEGRARAIFARQLDIKAIPVMIVYEPGIIPTVVKEKVREDYYAGKVDARQYVETLALCIEGDRQRRKIIDGFRPLKTL